MATKTGVNIYINGVKHNITPQPDTQTAYDISDVVGAGETFNVQFSNVYDDGGESALTAVQTFTLVASTINIQSLVVSADTLLVDATNYKGGAHVFGSQLYHPTILHKNNRTTFLTKESGTDRVIIIESTPWGLRPPHTIRGTYLNDHDYHDQPTIFWENNRFYIIQEDGHGAAPTSFHKAKALNDTLIIDSNAGTLGGTTNLTDIAYPLVFNKAGKVVIIGRYDVAAGNDYNAGYKIADSIEGPWSDITMIAPKPTGAARRYQSAVSSAHLSPDIIFVSAARSIDIKWFSFNVIRAKPQADGSLHYYTIDGRLVSQGTMTDAQATMTEFYNTGSNTIDALQPVIDIDADENFYAIHKTAAAGDYVLSIWKVTETAPTQTVINFPDAPTLVESSETQLHAVREIIPNSLTDITIFVSVNNGTRTVIREYNTTDTGVTWTFIKDIDFGVDVAGGFKIAKNHKEILDNNNFLSIGAGQSVLTTDPIAYAAKKVAFGAIQAEPNIYDTIPLITEATNNANALFGMKIEAGKINNTGTTLNSIIDQATGATINALGSPVLDNGTTPTFVTFDGVNDAISLSPTLLPANSGILFTAIVADAVIDSAIFSISNNTATNQFVASLLNSGGRDRITNIGRYGGNIGIVDGDTALPAGYNVVSWLYRGNQHDVPMWVNGKMQTRNVNAAPPIEEGSYTFPLSTTNLEIGRLVRTTIAYYGMKMKYAYIHNVTSEQEILERIKYAANFAGITLNNAYR